MRKKDPFRNFKLRYIRNERDYLTERELDLIEGASMTIGLTRVKDVFLFSCYTGLSYIDIKELHPNQVLMGIDGNQMIHTKRIKTSTHHTLTCFVGLKSKKNLISCVHLIFSYLQS